ncbi:unnamed protein product [Phaedon cochleariae]|uniref:Uncharacterized protein n=1 Tax=Phaedon cochleariae TaxID=80249 RepID=A0A9N9S8S7_PHACE|nr:unnamed protein product [Phaedon cochleariae]
MSGPKQFIKFPTCILLGLPLLTEDHLTSTMGMKLGPALKLRSMLAKRLGSCGVCLHCSHCHGSRSPEHGARVWSDTTIEQTLGGLNRGIGITDSAPPESVCGSAGAAGICSSLEEFAENANNSHLIFHQSCELKIKLIGQKSTRKRGEREEKERSKRGGREDKERRK